MQAFAEEEWNSHLEAVALRLRDKKVPVRKETAKELMAVYRCTLWNFSWQLLYQPLICVVVAKIACQWEGIFRTKSIRFLVDNAVVLASRRLFSMSLGKQEDKEGT